MRHHQLIKVIPAMKTLQNVLLVHPEPIISEVPRRRCFCNVLQNQKMLLCEGCDEWYHLDCIGVSEEAAQELPDWRCGYCRTNPDKDGNQTWQLAIPKGSRKRTKVAPDRNVGETPKARGVATMGNEMVKSGPETWEDIEVIVKERAKVLRAKEKAQKKQAGKLVKAGGHHITDAVSLAGVTERGVGEELVDEFVGLGEIENDDDDMVDDE